MAIEIREIAPDYDNTRILDRPDGFYWQLKKSDEEFGPFPSLKEAVEDMKYPEASAEVEESLEEAESQIGIADWIDPETGQPAEESIPHIEDH